MVDRRDNLWRRRGLAISSCAALILLAACGAPSTPTNSADSAQAAPSPTPPGRRADAPPPVPVSENAGADAANAAGAVRPPRASLAELREHALSVRTHGAEDPSRCGLTAPRSASPPSSVQLFFGCTPESGPVVAAVPARVVSVPAGTAAELVALRSLLAGPTAEERKAGYVSNFGEGSRGVGVEVEIRNDGMAVVNFDQAIRAQARAFVSNLDARQVVATLGQFPRVERVLILIEGEPLCKALGEC